MTTPTIAAIAGVLLAAVLTGCANTPDIDPGRVEEDFGKSVNNMIRNQIYDPAAARKPAAEPPMGLDGVQGQAILKSHRENVGSPEEVDKDVDMDISTESQ